MDDKFIEDVVYRIICGFYFIEVDNILYKIKSPSLSIKRQAHFIYSSTLENNKFESGWITENQIRSYLQHFDLWNNEKEKLLKQLEEQLQQTKIQLYLQFYNEGNKKSLKKDIDTINKNIISLIKDKHCLDYLTLENYALSLQNQFLISKTVYLDDKLLFNNSFDDINTKLLEKIILEIHKNNLSPETFKIAARSYIWKAFWSAGSNNIFNNATTELTDEQISLLNISKLLDNIRDHPDSPSEDIVNDLDAIDGWLYYQNEKTEKEKKKQAIIDKYGLDKKNGKEVFLVTNSKEEAVAINSLNDKTTQMNIKEMHKVAKDKGEMKWADVPFVQREIRSQMSQARRS